MNPKIKNLIVVLDQGAPPSGNSEQLPSALRSHLLTQPHGCLVVHRVLRVEGHAVRDHQLDVGFQRLQRGVVVIRCFAAHR